MIQLCYIKHKTRYDMTKLISWNLNGMRAAWNHGLRTFLDTCGADIYAFQETKTSEPFAAVEIEGYHAFWSFNMAKKGYSGTCCLSRRKPLNVWYDMGDPSFNAEGRIIVLEFDTYFVVNCYVPKAQGKKIRRDYRNQWDMHLLHYLSQLQVQKSVIVCGDFNVAIMRTDIYEQSPYYSLGEDGFISTERESILGILSKGFVDSYRYIHPDEQHKFTWWSNRRFKRRENKGWRLDYFFVSNEIKEKIWESTMLTDVLGSDHCPILLEIDLPNVEPIQPTILEPKTDYTYQSLLRLASAERRAALRQLQKGDMTNFWNSIDWEEAEKHLANMQMALAKVAYTRNLERITKWQKEIVLSLDAKLLAVKHTCETGGGPGLDGIKWTTPHEKMVAAFSLSAKSYHTLPSRLLVVESKKGKQRHIHIETYYDRAMQCLFAYALDPIAESWADIHSYAYRKGRSTYDLNEYIKNMLSDVNAPTWLFITDVKQCYENISHEWIKANIPMNHIVLGRFLKAGYVFGGELFPTDIGVGIGCTISPIIANMALDGLHSYVNTRLEAHGNERTLLHCPMARYADDIIFMAWSEDTAYRIKLYIEDFLRERGLAISPEKSKVVNISEGFSLMSRTYYKLGDHVYARPSDESVERFKKNIRETIENFSGSQKTLIEKLNHKIDGWATYHKVDESEEAFRQMDVYISSLLLKLCESKHPKWSREKIIDKYWIKDAEGRYCYSLPDKRECRVKFLADTLLVDYISLKPNMNPYIHLDYFEKRTKDREIVNVTGIFRTIWNRQDGKCHYCGRAILREEKKALVEAYPEKRKFAARMAYVHGRCLYTSFDTVSAPSLPESQDDVNKLLEQLDTKRKPLEQRFVALSDYFRHCEKRTFVLTFNEMETIMGEPLGATANRKEYWQRTGFGCISQCWLENGYEIRNIHTRKRQIAFARMAKHEQESAVNIPQSILLGHIPDDAKYELQNFIDYLVKKYGL